MRAKPCRATYSPNKPLFSMRHYSLFSQNRNKRTHEVAKKTSLKDVEEQGKIILEEYKKSFKIREDIHFSSLRIYSRILMKETGETRKDSFITFKPRIESIAWNQSPLLNQLIQRDVGHMSYGLALYKGIKKFWVAPYGNQVEFMNTLNTNYVPFINLPNNPGIPHFIGFFPEQNYHQIYYYLGKNTTHVDPRLAELKADYFAFSRTYDNEWRVVKENTYAIRVPFSSCSNMGCCEFPSVCNDRDVCKLPPNSNLNFSFRSVKDNDKNRTSDEKSISYLCYKI